MFHPWRSLRAMTHVVVVWARPHPAAPGATDGATRIWLDPRMSQVERRCVLAHELVHLEHGHRGCQPPAVENRVRAETARLLVTAEDLLAALPWALSLEELADELWVTPLVAADRLLALTPDEAAACTRASERPA
ncbi:ImmA/IrrE family metallo-endopeptidase [Micrococcus sp.]|uniref:ImmA/IrrE family metallo-endopeptidase n=1 Tax=Micrococcus sp. TaxID=1271 RepID=UPI002A909FCF|nr:ImmA/IrrE family metallo-endopeptidase [Micrococcus sp.]MDY6054378.1 ImmA/IrrE family metallo-endopeptidase [Micrococcus sp.]